jgi:hypothetical protein
MAFYLKIGFFFIYFNDKVLQYNFIYLGRTLDQSRSRISFFHPEPDPHTNDAASQQCFIFTCGRGNDAYR